MTINSVNLKMIKTLEKRLGIFWLKGCQVKNFGRQET